VKQVKKHLNPISSAIRPKKRYVLFHIHSDERLNDQRVVFAISNFFLEKLGSLETARYRLHVVKYHSASGKGILRCAREKEKKTKKFLETIKHVDKIPVTIQVTKVSGTIKTLKEGF
jgi:RNase P/RNase MRP subunit POP5